MVVDMFTQRIKIEVSRH